MRDYHEWKRIPVVTLGVMVSVLLAVFEPKGRQNTLRKGSIVFILRWFEFVPVKVHRLGVLGWNVPEYHGAVCINGLHLEIEHWRLGILGKFSVKFLGKLKPKGFYNKLDLSNWMTNLLHTSSCLYRIKISVRRIFTLTSLGSPGRLCLPSWKQPRILSAWEMAQASLV